MIFTLLILLQSFCSFIIQTPTNNPDHLDQISQILPLADSIANSLDPKPKKGNIIQINHQFYLLFDGISDVYQIQGDCLEIISNENIHGHNFGRSIFYYSDTIYSYGGSGFWTFFPDLTFFDYNSGKWEIVPVATKKPFFDGGIQEFAFLKNGKLFAFFAGSFPHTPIRERIQINSDKLKIFDLETKSWSSSNLMDDMTKVIFNYKVETNNFLVIYDSGFPVWLIDKRNLNLFQLPKPINKFGFFNRDFAEKYHLLTSGDSVWILNSGPDYGIIKAFDFAKDFEEISQNELLVGFNKISKFLWFFTLVFLCFFLSLIFLIKVKINEMRTFEAPNLLFKIGVILSREELSPFFQKIDINDSAKIEKLLVVKKIKRVNDKRLFDYILHCQGIPLIFKISLFIFKRYFYREEVIEA